MNYLFNNFKKNFEIFYSIPASQDESEFQIIGVTHNGKSQS